MRKGLIISASTASVFIGGCILAGAAMLQYKPAPQHVEFEITKQNGMTSKSHFRQITYLCRRCGGDQTRKT